MAIFPLHPFFVRNFVYPLYRGFRQDRLLEALEDLENNEWLSPDELEDLQWKKVKWFLSQITTYVPYYRDLFMKHGIRPDDIQSPQDFARIPLLTKEIIRRSKEALVTKDPLRRGFPSSTGGSTGEPLYFFGDAASGPLRRANTLRCYRWAGVDIGDRKAFLWGTSLNLPLKKRVVDGIKNYFNNMLFLSTFDLSPDRMADYARELRRFKPKVLTGYPSALETFARFVKESGLDGFGLKAVVTSGEELFSNQRELIEDALKAPVFNRYGSREFSNVAHECSVHRGMHIFTDLFFIEIVDEEGRGVEPGEKGELVITDLSNLYMPFLRYRSGDIAVKSDRMCECGRALPLIEKIEGRSFDIIRTPSGKEVGGFFWTWLSRAVPGIERFQVVQRHIDGIIFNIVPGREWRDENRVVLEEKIKENCGQDFKVAFIIKEDIPLTASGKVRFIVSEMSEKKLIKSKIHKARITSGVPNEVDCLKIDRKLMELADIAPYEHVLVVDMTSGSRVETFAVEDEAESGSISACGDVAKHLRKGDEVSIMAFTWSSRSTESFRNILVDEKNRFVKYLSESGEKEG